MLPLFSARAGLRLLPIAASAAAPLLAPARTRGSAGFFGRRLASLSPASPASPAAYAPASPSAPSPPGPPVYKTKKVWPPDFSKLSPQEQLRFEKRFKRRVSLRAERPRWVKFVKLAQLFTITFVTIYCVLFMEWTQGPTPVDGFRTWFWDTLQSLQAGGRSPLRSKENIPAAASGSTPAAK